MAAIVKLSALAGSFPAVEVEYQDMLETPFLLGGRWGGGGIDCLGVALEIFRRAGLGFPDPTLSRGGLMAFAEFFERVPEPDHLYDLINVCHEGQRSALGLSNHLSIVIRPDRALSIRAKSRVIAPPLSRIKTGAQFFRVKSSCLPT